MRGALILALAWALLPSASEADFALSYDNRAGSMVTDFQKGDLRSAFQEAEESLAAVASHEGDLSPGAAWREEDLGVLAWHLARWEDSEKRLVRARALFEAAGYGEDQERVRLKLALLAEAVGRPKVEEAEALGLSTSLPLAWRLEARALAARLGSTKRDWLKENVEDCRKTWPDGSEAWVKSEVDLALARLKAGDRAEAARQLGLASDWQDRNLGPKDAGRIAVWLAEARLTETEGHPEEAKSLRQRALQRLDGLVNAERGRDPWTLFQRAKLRAALDDHRAADDFKAAQKIFKLEYGPGHPTVAACRRELSRL